MSRSAFASAVATSENQHAEKRPLLEHFEQRRLAVQIERALESRRHAEPARQQTPVLRPGEVHGAARGSSSLAVELLGALRLAADSLDHVDTASRRESSP